MSNTKGKKKRRSVCPQAQLVEETEYPSSVSSCPGPNKQRGTGVVNPAEGEGFRGGAVWQDLQGGIACGKWEGAQDVRLRK